MARWCWLLALAAAGTAQGDGDEKPFPTRTVILSREGVTYYVEGRQTIPWGAEVSVQKEARIVGRGPEAVLVVEGGLKVHGVAGGEVYIEGLVIELAPRSQEVRLDTVIFVSGAVKTGEQPSSGRVIVENTDFCNDTLLDVALTAGDVNLINSTFFAPVRIRGAAPEGGKCTLKAFLNGCFYDPSRPKDSKRSAAGGFLQGLAVESVPTVTVRNCRMTGSAADFLDCGKLTFDGNRVDAKDLAFRQTEAGRFKSTKVQKCDISTPQVRFHAPAAKRRDVVPIDKCWFRGLTKRDEIEDKVIRDGKDDPECSVVVVIRKVNERPLGLAGSVEGQ